MPTDRPNNSESQPLLTSTQSPSPPRRIAAAVGDWVRSSIVMIIWVVALSAVVAAGYVVLRALLFLLALVQRSLNL